MKTESDTALSELLIFM